MSNEIKFSVDSLLISELGERLVTKNYIAMAELIKNAYDADATSVQVRFLNSKKEKKEDSKIIISDNGHGMTFNQIRDFWMRIATPNKKRNPISPKYLRTKTGDKGIGRFSCDRLSKKLVLESKAILENGKVEFTKVVFEWDKYKEGETLTEVPNYYIRETLDSECEIGTTLNLIDLRDTWTQRDFDVLRRQVLSLSIVTPEKRKTKTGETVEDPGFTILLDAPEFSKGMGALSEQVMDAGWGRLRGKIDSTGKAILTLQAHSLGKVTYELPELFEEIPGVVFDIAIIIHNKDYLRDKTTLSMSLVNEVFANYSGVRVYLGGFRIYPYGDTGIDWLDIDKDVSRRFKPANEIFRDVSKTLLGVEHDTAMLRHPSNRNLLGGVHIRGQPKIFEVTLNREGLIENKAFERLKTFIRQSLEWATLHYNHFIYVYETEKYEEVVEEFEGKRRDKKGITEKNQRRSVVESAFNVISGLSEEVAELLPEEKGEEIRQYSHSALKVIEQSVSLMEKEINFLRLVASSGALMWTLIHEARIIISRLDTHANSLELISKDLGNTERKRLSEIISELRVTRDRFDNQILLLGKTGARAELAKRTNVQLSKIIDEVVQCYSTFIKEFGINIEVEVSSNLRVGPIFESELYSIVINLLSNSIKAVLAGDGDRIKVEATRNEKGAILKVYDTGIGIPNEMKDLVMEPFVADPDGRLYKRLKEKIRYDQRSILGEGSGMGLSIVRDIVESYGLDLRFLDAMDPWKTVVEVGLP